MSSDFERVVTRAMREPAEAGTPCPSAETLAAYLDGALGRDEHAAIELHASRCSTCATHLAALVQLEDQLAAGAAPPLPWWRRRPWLVPAAAAILAGVVWTSLPRDRVAELTRPVVTEAPHASGDGRAQAPATPDLAPAPPIPAKGSASPRHATPKAAPPPAASAPSAAAPAREEEVGMHDDTAATLRTQAEPRDEKDTLANELAPSRTRADAGRAKAPKVPKVPALAGDTAPGRIHAERRGLEESTEAMATPPAAAAVRPAPAPASARARRAPEPSSAAGTAAGSTDAVARNSSARAAGASPEAAAQQPPAVRQESSAGVGSTIVTSAADSLVAWRVTGRQVERTLDGGAHWLVEPAPPLAAPVVGSSPSRDVCWLAGAGTVLLRRTADSTWSRVHVPADLLIAAVEARSAREASLVGTDGRRFTTADGGTSWKETP